MKNPLMFSIMFFAGVCEPSSIAAQFNEVEVPSEMATFDFMVGDWNVEGAFRTPDFVGTDRTLWYLTRGGGITRFDGRTWTAFQPGSSSVGDSVLAAISAPGEPYQFSNVMHVERVQDDFVLMIDEGRTSGTTMIYFDAGTSSWISQSIHAPTNTVTRSKAASDAQLPVFEGTGTDRRGQRIFRRHFEIHSPDHFTVRTNVSFDEGVTWIDNQIVQEVRRK